MRAQRIGNYPIASFSVVEVTLAWGMARGESVIKCPSPLSVLKDNTMIAVIEHVQMNISG